MHVLGLEETKEGSVGRHLLDWLVDVYYAVFEQLKIRQSTAPRLFAFSARLSLGSFVQAMPCCAPVPRYLTVAFATSNSQTVKNGLQRFTCGNCVHAKTFMQECKNLETRMLRMQRYLKSCKDNFYVLFF